MRIRSLRRTAALMSVVAVGSAAALAALPARAAFDAGGGSVSASVVFNSGQGVPPLNAKPTPPATTFVCSFNFTVTLTGAVINLNGTQYITTSPATLNGSGSDSDCNLDQEGPAGTSLSIPSVNLQDAGSGTSFTCPLGVSGAYTRVATHTDILLHGSCKVNALGPDSISFRVEGEFTPVIQVGTQPFPDGDGLDGSSITQASFTGAFAVTP
jgi:hypothetical protein